MVILVLTFVSEHWVSVGSNLGQRLENCHDHLVIHSKVVLTHEDFKLFVYTYQNLKEEGGRIKGDGGRGYGERLGSGRGLGEREREGDRSMGREGGRRERERGKGESVANLHLC